jgi:PEP-CTERM putative exosortase interaction domain/autotransporter-associated beta strand repeat
MLLRFALPLAILAAVPLHAQSVWQATTNKNWSTSGNWSSGVPNSDTAIAQFGATSQPDVNITGTLTVDRIEFTANAPAYTFAHKNGSTLTFAGAGIVNSSSATQTFDLKANNAAAARIVFTNSASAGNAAIAAQGTSSYAGAIDFLNTSSAGTAQLTLDKYGSATFDESATAANAKITIQNNGGSVTFKSASTAASADITLTADASLVFSGNSSAGSAQILATYAPATLAQIAPAQISFTDNATAGSATIDTTRIDFSGNATAGNAAFTLRGYANFKDSSTAGSATFTVNGGQVITFDNTSSLASANLTMGTNSGVLFKANSTGGSGTISGGNWLYKTGAGTVVLSGDLTYSGSTEVEAGALFINGSLTNTTMVTVRAGASLGGSGRIDRGTFIHAGARLEPGGDAHSAGTLTFGYALIFSRNATIDFDLGTVSDLIHITSGWISGPSGDGGITLNLFDSGGFTAGTYTLFDFSTGEIALYDFDLSDFVFGETIDGFNYSLAFEGNTLALTATSTAIPEPSTYATFFGLAALGFCAFRKRRSR